MKLIDTHSLLYDEAFDPDRDYWWPVPADQILLNKKLEQNPNY